MNKPPKHLKGFRLTTEEVAHVKRHLSNLRRRPDAAAVVADHKHAVHLATPRFVAERHDDQSSAEGAIHTYPVGFAYAPGVGYICVTQWIDEPYPLEPNPLVRHQLIDRLLLSVLSLIGERVIDVGQVQ